MGRTAIEWTDYSWNPITGCTPISEGCENCYARRMAQRLRGRFGYSADAPFKVTLHPDRLEEPFRWHKPRKVFVCSMGDLFHEQVPDEYIAKVWEVMSNASQHTFIVLTKRPQRMKEFIERLGWYIHDREGNPTEAVLDKGGKYTLKNVWLGVTAENQARADERIPILLGIPAEMRFVSVEPMLGPVDLGKYFTARQMTCKACGHTFWSYEAEFCEGHLVYYCGCRGFADECHCKYSRTLKCPRCGKCVCDRVKKWATEGRLQKESGRYAWVLDRDKWQRLDWVICGGETGPGARPIHPDWVRSLRDQCQAAGTPFFFKQWGEWLPNDQEYGANPGDFDYERPHVMVGNVAMCRAGKKRAGRLLDGRTWDEMPEI